MNEELDNAEMTMFVHTFVLVFVEKVSEFRQGAASAVSYRSQRSAASKFCVSEVVRYQDLKTTLTRHADQKITPRNLEARNEKFETGVLLKTRKWKNVSVERTHGECYQWKAKVIVEN